VGRGADFDHLGDRDLFDRRGDPVADQPADQIPPIPQGLSL
jgi:hypothetical protein